MIRILQEILVGITGNLACKPYSLEEINKNNSLRQAAY